MAGANGSNIVVAHKWSNPDARPDAIIADKVSGVYADPDKVKVVHHEGKYYKCHGRHFCAPSPQGRPVL
jgi:alkanesulfonate monooxygenase SsuD/methylene tetrahydromethanopterin reductase-like flavin-dependent oxidoreductase (luciferase family)